MALVSRMGPLGLRQEYTYDEVLRAIGQQPLDLPHPKRTGLKTYEDIFYSNLINDQTAYQGDHAKSGFAHDAPRPPPHRPDVYFDARSDHGGGGGDGDDDGDGQGPSHPFGRMPDRLPIQSGRLLPDFVGEPLQLPDLPNPRHNFIEEEGLSLPPEPPGFFGQAHQAAQSGFREGAVNRVSELGALAGGAAADMASNRLRQLGGVIRDGALDYRDFYFRELPEMMRGAFGRRPPPPPQDFAQAAAEAAGAAEEAEMANIGVGGLLGAAEAGGAMDGAEAGGIFGGIPGMAVGAGIGGAAAETARNLMFQNREAPQGRSTFLDARTLNNESQSIRPVQPRFHRFEGFEEAASGSNQAAQYFDISSRPQSREVLRPSSAPMPQVPERSAQSVIDETAAPAARRERVRLTRNRAPPSDAIEGDVNPGLLADRVPKENYRDILQATGARNKKRPGENSGSPYAFPMSGAPMLPARPSSSRGAASNRRNKAPPKKKEDDPKRRPSK